MLGFMYTQAIWVHITNISKHRFRFSVCTKRRLLTVTLNSRRENIISGGPPLIHFQQCICATTMMPVVINIVRGERGGSKNTIKCKQCLPGL